MSGYRPEFEAALRLFALTRTDIWAIWNGVSATKREVIMALMPSKADEPIPTLEEWAAEVARRRARYGNPELPRNSGKNRTESKKALLKAIEDAGGKW